MRHLFSFFLFSLPITPIANAQSGDQRSFSFDLGAKFHSLDQRNIPPTSTTSIYLKDSAVTWHWDASSSSWKYYNEDLYSYDVYSNMVRDHNKVRFGNSWINFSKDDVTYNSNATSATATVQSWNTNVWTNSQKYINNYDLNLNLTGEIAQTWSGNWVNTNYFQYTYDVNNNVTSFLMQNWSGSWVNYIQEIYSYDVNNNQVGTLRQTWNGNAWVNDNNSVNTFDVNNHMITQIGQLWNGSSWDDISKNTFTWNTNNNWTSMLQQQWNGSTWINSWEYLYTYDVNFNMLNMLFQTWNGSAWVNNTQYNYTYDVNNNTVSYVTQNWGSNWVNADSTHYYYHFSTGVTEAPATSFSVRVYPDPAVSEFTIETNASLMGSTVEVYDLIGKKILTQYVPDEVPVKINCSTWNEGAYLLFIRNKDEVTVKKKMMVVK